MDRLQEVKNSISCGEKNANNLDAIEYLLQVWFDSKASQRDTEEATESSTSCDASLNSYVKTDRLDVNQPMFLTTKSSVQSLLGRIHTHADRCQSAYQWHSHSYHGHAVITSLRCRNGHTTSWSSSSYLPNREFLVNHRFAFAYLACGMIPSQYQRLAEGANMGVIGHSRMQSITSRTALAVQSEKENSCTTAILTEIASYEDLSNGVEIMTDARHGWRKNSKDSDVVCIGQKTHQVLHNVHVSTEMEPSPQKHEIYGTRILYDHLDNFQNTGVHVAVHAHDSNASVNKYVREERPGTVNQNDTWHGANSAKKAVVAVSSGPRYKHGDTWHEELADKPASVRIHFQWSMRNCDGNPELLLQYLDNIVEHYANNHAACHPTSRCRTDANYVPSKVLVRNAWAVELLRKAIRSTIVYKQPANYCRAQDTFYVESFNNTLNIWHDKRINFMEMQFKMRTNWAILHWNENVDRPFTSIWEGPAHNAQGHGVTKKVLSPCTYVYRDTVWNTYMGYIFE